MNRKITTPQKLAQLASLKGLTQVQMAKRAGILPSNLNLYLRGRKDVNATLFLRLLKALEVDVDDLLNAEIARLHGMQLKEKAPLGDLLEQITNALDGPDRDALLAYTAKVAQVNLGARAKTQVRQLRSWMQ